MNFGTLRVLVLGVSTNTIAVQHMDDHGIKLVLTFEPESEYLTRALSYQTTDVSRLLASQASLASFECVIIGNNVGTGYDRARLLPAELLPRTMIAWDDYQPAEAAPYADLYITHFGNRQSHKGGYSIKDFLIEMADLAAISSRRI
jgi:hypothetical protein